MKQFIVMVIWPRNVFEEQQGRGSLIMGFLVGLLVFVLLA